MFVHLCMSALMWYRGVQHVTYGVRAQRHLCHVSILPVTYTTSCSLQYIFVSHSVAVSGVAWPCAAATHPCPKNHRLHRSPRSTSNCSSVSYVMKVLLR
jgi:hypothetical protein